MAEYMQGWFKPKHPEKYKGNPKNIVYRSSWEMKYMLHLDNDPAVVEWQSEEFCIPYTNPKTGRFARYFPDFLVKKKDKYGVIETFVIEIKPMSQSVPPKRGEKSKKVFINEVATFAVNQAKWESAERYCQKMGYQFVVLTEKELKVF